MRHLGKSVKSRLMQCPSCWAGGFVPQGEDWQECECGEKLTLVDLRERPSETKITFGPSRFLEGAQTW